MAVRPCRLETQRGAGGRGRSRRLGGRGCFVHRSGSGDEPGRDAGAFPAWRMPGDGPGAPLPPCPRPSLRPQAAGPRRPEIDMAQPRRTTTGDVPRRLPLPVALALGALVPVLGPASRSTGPGCGEDRGEGFESGGDDEGSGARPECHETRDTVHSGARLIVRHDAASETFPGTVINGIDATRVRVEVHLVGAPEPGPTDVAPGEMIMVGRVATGRSFARGSTHRGSGPGSPTDPSATSTVVRSLRGWAVIVGPVIVRLGIWPGGSWPGGSWTSSPFPDHAPGPAGDATWTGERAGCHESDLVIVARVGVALGAATQTTVSLDHVPTPGTLHGTQRRPAAGGLPGAPQPTPGRTTPLGSAVASTTTGSPATRRARLSGRCCIATRTESALRPVRAEILPDPPRPGASRVASRQVAPDQALRRAGNGIRVSPMRWTGVSSKHTTGRRGSGASLYRSSRSSIRATYSITTQEMHHILRCQGLTDCSPKRRRTVSRESSSCSVRCTISSAGSSSVQRARPAGGSEHATATSNVSSRPVSLRLDPARGCSLNAISRHFSRNRRLVRYTVDVRIPTVVPIAAMP